MSYTSTRLDDYYRMMSGDIVALQYRVVEATAAGAAGAAIDLSAFTAIAIKVFALGADGRPSGAALITDALAADITLVSGGTTGLFQQALALGDTASLSGAYWVQVKLTDAAAKVRTCKPFILHIDSDLITA